MLNGWNPELYSNSFSGNRFYSVGKKFRLRKANNIGLEKAYKNGADFFYLMNQDAWIYPESLDKLLKAYEKHPHRKEIGILSQCTWMEMSNFLIFF